ncbi:MAG: tyrosine-type recombinase/integrase [Thermoleophilia bacterium]
MKRCRHRGVDRDTCRCTWYIRDRTGGRDTYTPVGQDRPAAERALARHDAEPAETVTQAVDLWLTRKKAAPKARPNSIASYESRAGHIREYFGDDPVRSLRDRDLIRFVDDLLAEDYAPATVQGIYAALTSTLRHAQRRGVIKALPLPPDGPGIPTVTPRRHDLTLGQVEAIIADMPSPWGPVAELVLLTGLRWGEIVAVRPDDIQGSVVHVRRTQNRYGSTNDPKTEMGRRVVPLSRRARRLFADLELPVGGDYREARKALVAAMGALHQPGMGWHTIRNAHASLLDSAGVSLRESAARMGHGPNYAQTLAYGVRAEVGRADALDRARRRHAASSSAASGPSAAPAEPASIEEARRRRRRAAP